MSDKSGIVLRGSSSAISRDAYYTVDAVPPVDRGSVSNTAVLPTSVSAPSQRNVHSLDIDDQTFPFGTRVQAALFELKATLAQFAMHLSLDERARLFKFFDRLVNEGAWHQEDELPVTESLRSFIRWTILTRWISWSSIGFSHNGNLLVSWRNAGDQITAEFLPADRVRWTVALLHEGRRVVSAGTFDIRDFPRLIRSLVDLRW